MTDEKLLSAEIDSLLMLITGDKETAESWKKNHNTALGGTPNELPQKDVVEYLRSRTGSYK